jgi:HSF-type DNA-binding
LYRLSPQSIELTRFFICTSRFFSQSKYASFQRQLNLYGFSRMTHGVDKGAYWHDCFVRHDREKVRGMIRRKIKGTRVRRALSVEQEPNFYDLGTMATTATSTASTVGALTSSRTSSICKNASQLAPNPPVVNNTWAAFDDVVQHDFLLLDGPNADASLEDEILSTSSLFDSTAVRQQFHSGSFDSLAKFTTATSQSTISNLCSV